MTRLKCQSREVFSVLWVRLIKNSLGRKGLIWLTGYAQAPREFGAGTQHRDPREDLKNEEKPVEEHC